MKNKLDLRDDLVTRAKALAAKERITLTKLSRKGWRSGSGASGLQWLAR